MSLLDDARRLAEAPEPCSGDRRWFCGAWSDEQHKPGCLWLALPRIVAVVEAAERMMASPTGPTGADDVVGVPADTLRMVPADAYDALVAALRGGTLEPLTGGVAT